MKTSQQVKADSRHSKSAEGSIRLPPGHGTEGNQTRSTDRTNTRQRHSADDAQADTTHPASCAGIRFARGPGWLPGINKAGGRGRGPGCKVGGRERKTRNKQSHKTRTTERNRTAKGRKNRKRKTQNHHHPTTARTVWTVFVSARGRCRLVGQPLGSCFVADS